MHTTARFMGGSTARCEAAQELLDRCNRARRVFLLRHVPQAVEAHQAAALDVVREALAVRRRNEPVARAPQDQGGHGDPRDARGVLSRNHLREALAEGPAVARPQGQFVVALDERVGDARGIAVDVAQARDDQTAWQEMLGEPAASTRMSAATRFGASAATFQAISPPSELPPMTQRCTPSASSSPVTKRT